MSLKDKKFIPFYIIGTVLIVLAIVIVIIFTSVGTGDDEETTTLPQITEPDTLFMNGEVPYYPDVAASAYKKENFVLSDDGRIAYSDPSVKFETGIDVSAHQGTIDWEAVAADGIEFAIIRIGFRGYGKAGNICKDDMAEKNLKGAYNAGIKTGVYFYSQAINADEAKEEADFVLDLIKNYHIDYPVVFDWENEPDKTMRTDGMTGDEMTECAVSFCNTIKSAGYTPAVYLNLSFAYNKYDLSRIKYYPIWYAQYEKSVPDMYYHYNIWQYSAKGSVSGIDTQVDMNISFSDFGNKVFG